MLGAAVERSFKDELRVQQHSFPPPNVSSGSFVADVDLGLGHDWDPSRGVTEVITCSVTMVTIGRR